MCGIAGALSRAPIAPSIVEHMRDEVAHRGPDAAGLWSSSDGCVCLGHRRLSIIDLDARSNQPMRSADGRLVLTFNGEIYNYREVRRALQSEGVTFRTESDTEVLLEAYRRWGAGVLDRLSGMFAFAIWDADRRELFCARDRAGEKPFYYAAVNGSFVFASELKSLLAWPGVPRRVDYDALIDFLSFGFVADPKSIWMDVRKLPPAHAMTVHLPLDADPVAQPPRRYWSLPFGRRDRAVSAEEIRATLLHAASEMAVADVPLGTFLSGGVDSSTVTAALSLSGHDVRTFTIGFEDEAYDERAWARQVAERYHTHHVERVVGADDVTAVMERLDWHYDEPFSDYSSIPTYYLCREARSAVTVALSGDGADEIFAGYRKYQRLVRREELRTVFPVGVAHGVAAVARYALAEGNHWRRTLSQYGLAAPQMLADALSIVLPLPLLRRVARGPLAAALEHYDPHRLVEQILVDAPPHEIGLVNAMRHLDLALTLPGDMLVKVDRASMAVALEIRPLFLHRDVMELAASIPADRLVDRHAAKLALKDAVRPWLPDALLDRRKQGFAMPLPKWLSGDAPLLTVGSGAGDRDGLGELLDMRELSMLQTRHSRGAADFTAIIHASTVLRHWLARWQ
jgi:asparagine synthase (glutamine-hydrolysing)